MRRVTRLSTDRHGTSCETGETSQPALTRNHARFRRICRRTQTRGPARAPGVGPEQRDNAPVDEENTVVTSKPAVVATILRSKTGGRTPHRREPLNTTQTQITSRERDTGNGTDNEKGGKREKHDQRSSTTRAGGEGTKREVEIGTEITSSSR